MDHIIQFAVDIDDDAIERRILDHAENRIIEDIKTDVIKKLVRPSYYGKTPDISRDPLTEFSEDLLKAMLEEHKEEILSRASAELANRLARSKAGKAILEGLKNG